MTDAAELAARAAAVVTSGDGALATVTAERSLLLRFARSRPTQATAVEDVSVSISVLRDGHVGSASTNRSDDDALTSCARAAEAAADAAARTRGAGVYPGFPSPAPAPAHEGFDAATAQLDPAVGGAALATAFDVAAEHGVEAHGVWTAGDVETAIASRDGAVVRDRVTDAFMKVTCITPGGRSGWASAAGVSSSAADPRALAETAATKATGAFARRREVVKLEPGEYQVVLAPAAAGELVVWLGWIAFNGLAHAEGRGALVGRLGRRVVAPSINLSDSPRCPGTLPRSFDAEGVPKRPIPLIQDGVAHRVVHDTRSAALAGGGATTTGHALEPGGGPFGPVPTNMVMVGGGAASEAELCEPVERGIYVTRLWYTNVIRPNETLITGVTRDGTFLIEDGQIAAPIEDLRLTDSVLRVLGGTQALTSKTELWSEGEFYGRRFAYGVLTPALRAASMRFTGGA
jgi:predicted Zn-dependent protease